MLKGNMVNIYVVKTVLRENKMHRHFMSIKKSPRYIMFLVSTINKSCDLILYKYNVTERSIC